ncbi:MAG: radical SAM protein [Desulfobulbus sp.]|nr:radical SAM protein [Desulfobulbus sp.]
MKTTETCIFGPVPSRRLGRSLGINNIPAKHCTYACLYCQVGRTLVLMTDRRPFLEPNHIIHQADLRLAQLHRDNEPVDYLALVPDGEPTLDLHLGEIIAGLRQLGVPVAVISNGSLLGQQDVRDELALADWVSLKIDTVDEVLWRQINRPHSRLELGSILEGMLLFARSFKGILATETMLIKGSNDCDFAMQGVAAFLQRLRPHRSYLSIPTRPPAELRASAPDEATINRLYPLLAAAAPHLECLIGYEGNAFASTDDPEHDLLAITAVHPMRAEAVAALLDRTGSSWQVVERLLQQGDLIRTEHNGHAYYLRRFSRQEKKV